MGLLVKLTDIPFPCNGCDSHERGTGIRVYIYIPLTILPLAMLAIGSQQGSNK
jgi:hypothetical protein